MPDKFFETFGKLVAIVSFAFVVLCAIFFIGLAQQAYTESAQPTFTVAPDSARRAK